MNVVVVIPAYQAVRTIGPLVAEIRSQGLPVTVVDDASGDGTAGAAQAAGALVIRRAVNGGKGAAFRDGVAAALGGDCDWIITLDADGQHLASEIPLFLKEAERSGADLVVGNRMGRPRGMPLDRWLTNLVMSGFLSRIVGQRIPDTQCGFRMIRRRVLETIRLTSDRFEVESEMIVRTAWAGFRTASVHVSSVYRWQSSFIRPIRDTVRFLRFLWLLKRERPRGN